MHPNEPWRLLPQQADGSAADLAASSALLAGLAAQPQPAVRWYTAHTPALVLGSGQKLTEVDLHAAQQLDVPIYRRASGGTAVLFAPGLMMQDVALPITHPLYTTDVTASYRWLGELWVAVLASFGIDAALISVPDARADTASSDPLVRRACFGGRSPYELLVAGRKLVGFAQVRRRPGALLQVGVYTTWPGQMLADLLALSASERTHLTQRLDTRVVGLAELLPTPPTPAALIAQFAAMLAERHGVSLVPTPWSAAEAAQIATTVVLDLRTAPLTER
jgi:lipoate-protein ligase A